MKKVFLSLILVLALSVQGLAGTYTANNWFYKPDYSEKGVVPHALYCAALDTADVALQAMSNGLTALNALVTGWAPMENQDVLVPYCLYASATSFTVGGDFTNQFAANAKVRVDLGGGVVKASYVDSSSYAGGTTTVNIHDAILTNPLSGVWVTCTRNGLFPYGPGYVVARDYGLPGTTAFDNAIAAIGGLERTLVLTPGTWGVSTNPVPANIRVVAERGAIIAVGNGETQTLNKFDAGLYQVFSCTGTGKVLFGPGAVEKAYPEWWATNTIPGTTDMLAAVQASFDAFGENPGVVVLSNTYNVTSAGAVLSADNKTITGSGTIYGGPIKIGTTANSFLDFRFKLDGITVEYASVTSGQHGVELSYAWNSVIQNCKFINCDKAIYVNPIDSNQHFARSTIDNNRAFGCNYFFYGDQAASEMGTADVHITKNQVSGIALGAANETHYTHIYAVGLDGAIITDNILFFHANTAPYDLTKQYNIYISEGTWIHIQNNNLFCSGLESIVLDKCSYFDITGNLIAWPGERNLSSGVRIKGGNYTGAAYCLGTIADNVIIHPTYDGISIEDTCGYITLANNMVYNAGDDTYYYGDDPSIGNPAVGTVDHYGLRTGASTSYIYWGASPAMFGTTGQFFVQGTNSYRPQESALKNRVKALSATETTASALSYQNFNFAQSGATNFAGITGAYDGQTLYLAFFNSNTTLKNNDGGTTDINRILLKGGIDVTPAAGNRITLRYDNSRWREYGRNF